MSSSCTSILMGVVSSVSEIWLPFKNGQISLSDHGYSPWSSKNLIDRNRLKKFMQIGIVQDNYNYSRYCAISLM